MQFVILLIIPLITVAYSSRNQWNSFKNSYGKSYKNAIEEQQRLVIFEANLLKIARNHRDYDQGLVSYKLGINQFADLTSEEFLQLIGSTANNQIPVIEKLQTKHSSSIPDSINWVEKGAVEPDVYDQGSYTDYAYISVTGALEGQYYLAKQQLVRLSIDQLNDCCSNCTEHLPDNVYDYMHKYGMETAADYDSSRNSQCNYDSNKVFVNISSWIQSAPNDESELALTLADSGPLSIGINAEPIQFYAEGIFDGPCEAEVNFYALAVGYGPDYWLVKNSWGASWGENGYFRLKRDDGNLCCVACTATYPALKLN